jgi:hypothetical protein
MISTYKIVTFTAPKCVFCVQCIFVPMMHQADVLNVQEDPNGSVRFEVFTAVTMKNGVFWDITPCGSCKRSVACIAC